MIGPMWARPGGAERDQDGQRRLRPVGRGAEAVEAHGGHALEGADLASLCSRLARRRPKHEPADINMHHSCAFGMSGRKQRPRGTSEAVGHEPDRASAHLMGALRWRCRS